MTGSTERRAVPVKAWAGAGICLALLGAFGTWFLLGHETSPPCNGLAENESVRKSVGAAVHPGISCAALGEAIVKATAGSQPGRHTQAQAQAMKDVVFALGWVQSQEIEIDPALRVPLATALADYAPDVHEMLAGLDNEYIVNAGDNKSPGKPMVRTTCRSGTTCSRKPCARWRWIPRHTPCCEWRRPTPQLRSSRPSLRTRPA